MRTSAIVSTLGDARPAVARAGVWLERMTPHTPAIDEEEEPDHAGVLGEVEQQRF